MHSFFLQNGKSLLYIELVPPVVYVHSIIGENGALEKMIQLITVVATEQQNEYKNGRQIGSLSHNRMTFLMRILSLIC